MRRIYMVLGLVLCSPLVFKGNVLNVNNGVPSPGQYSTLQSAIDAAFAGDTLYLAGTGITYGAVNLNKQLTFIGPGIVVSGLSYSGVAQVGVISLTNIAASGSVFMGIRLFQVASTDALISIFTNITIKRCIVDDCLFLGNDDWTGCLIEGNVFTSTGPNTTGNSSTSNVINSTLRNNIFSGILFYVAADQIVHNIFPGVTNGNLNIFATTVNNTFQNNIAVGRNCSSVDATSVSTANMSYSCLNPNFPGAGNFPNTNPLFVGYTTGNFAWNHDHHLQAGSPAAGTGTGATDLGIYGGDGAFRKDLEPDIPVVRLVTLVGGNIHPMNSTISISVTGVAHE